MLVTDRAGDDDKDVGSSCAKMRKEYRDIDGTLAWA